MLIFLACGAYNNFNNLQDIKFTHVTFSKEMFIAKSRDFENFTW